MKTLGNIIWIVFGGLHIALEYFIAGLILMITIIGIVRYESEMAGVATRLSEHLHECAVVLRWRHLDMAYPHLLRPHILHHHHRHPIRKDALPTGKAGSFTFWERIRLNTDSI